MIDVDDVPGLDARDLQTVLMTVQALAQQQDLEGICDWVGEAVASLLGASFTAITLAAAWPEGAGRTCSTGKGEASQRLSTLEIARLNALEWLSVKTPGVAVLPAAQVPASLSRRGIVHVLRVPLRTIHRELGALIVGRGEPWALDAREITVLTTLANQSAVSVHNANLVREAREMALFAELNPGPVLRVDLDGTVISANRAAADLFGHGVDEGISLALLLPNLAGVDWGQLIREGRVVDRAATIGERHFHFVVRGVADLSIGHAYGTDITKRKRAEEALRHAHEELEARVVERTAELARLNERIERHAVELERRVAERTAELEAFSYSVSHDLRTPIRTIEGFARILLEEHAAALDPEGRRVLDTICTGAQTMGHLIDGLLAVSRMGRQEMHVTTIDMEEAVRSAWAELIANRAAPGARLELRRLPPARGDAALVRHVFVNLLSNGIKFSREREAPVIEVGGRFTDGENVYYVRDNGVGFDMQYADKLFGVFQRLHPAEEFEGTGVGLAIVRRVIQRHGGRTWATASVGDGAAIYFTLPPAEAASW